MLRDHWGTALLLALSTWATGCGNDRVVEIDQGKLCVYEQQPEQPHQNSPAQSYDADEQVYVSVTLGCVSACIQDEEAACWISRSGQTLHVHSLHTYRPQDAGKACIALCGSLSAVCASDPLPPGDYEIVHGDERYPLAVPSMVERPCL